MSSLKMTAWLARTEFISCVLVFPKMLADL